jgi:predicted DNA-binding transcriptional regulator YafY
MSANERRAEIMRIMEGRRFEISENLAVHFGVTERTIRSDIQVLMTEYPIDIVPGKGGGVRLMAGYKIYKGTLSEEQQNALFSAIATAADSDTARVLAGLLRAQGSFRNKEKIEEVINNLQS